MIPHDRDERRDSTSETDSEVSVFLDELQQLLAVPPTAGQPEVAFRYWRRRFRAVRAERTRAVEETRRLESQLSELRTELLLLSQRLAAAEQAHADESARVTRLQTDLAESDLHCQLSQSQLAWHRQAVSAFEAAAGREAAAAIQWYDRYAQANGAVERLEAKLLEVVSQSAAWQSRCCSAETALVAARQSFGWRLQHRIHEMIRLVRSVSLQFRQRLVGSLAVIRS